MRFGVFLLLTLLFACNGNNNDEEDKNAIVDDLFSPWEGGNSYYAKWSNGISSSENFFPIAVWSQNPLNASTLNYKNMGINVFVNIPQGPNENQLIALSNYSLTTICSQNELTLNSANKNIITGYHLASEPDNASGGVVTPTDSIIARYNRLKIADPSKPVYLCFGQGVVADLWYGRGDRTNHPEDYLEYVKGGDILAFDIYPMNVFDPPAGSKSYMIDYANSVKQKPWLVAVGVDRIRQYSFFKKPVWAWIECTNIDGHPDYALTPEIVKAEVWMALVHGARGIGYFVHTITPFKDSGVLLNTDMVNGITKINSQILELAPVLNTQSIANGATVVSNNKLIPVDIMVKRHNGVTYLFAVCMRGESTTVTFNLRNFVGEHEIDVIGENRVLKSANGQFQDNFTGYGVHIYKVVR